MSTERQRGFSLMELIITMVILGIAATGVLQLISLSTRSTADPVRRKQAMLIAEGLLEEVELARMTWCDPSDANVLTATSSTVGALPTNCATTPEAMGPELLAGNARPFDNVNDYSTLTNTTVDAAGNAFGGGAGAMSGYTASVAITSTDKLGPTGFVIDGTATPLALLRITVTVSYNPTASPVVLEGYRARYAPNSIP